MASLITSKFIKHFNVSLTLRHFSLCNPLLLKEIHKTQKDSTLIIEAKHVEQPKDSLALPHSDACSVCSTGLDIKHTDVLILSQFVRSDGCMLPKRITGLCRKQQRKVSALVTMAQKAGLMSNLTPATSKKDPKLRKKWKKFNTYFDESTIKN